MYSIVSESNVFSFGGSSAIISATGDGSGFFVASQANDRAVNAEIVWKQ